MFEVYAYYRGPEQPGRMMGKKRTKDAAIAFARLVCARVTGVGVAVDVKDKGIRVVWAHNPADVAVVAPQEWRLVDDGKGGTVTRSGSSFAELLDQRECYTDVYGVLARSSVGDCVSTGVSGYERIK